ncbi:cytidine deaminase-like protein [Aspergillus californicus]
MLYNTFTAVTLVTLTAMGTVNCHQAGPSPYITNQHLLHPKFNDSSGIPHSTREYWMRQTQKALVDSTLSPCPYIPFAAAIVNHTGKGLGDLICTGVNTGRQSGNAVLHGEISAIMNCSDILQDPTGRFRLSASETQAAFEGLSLYTNAESCPMCASAIRWTGFKEYIYATSISSLVDYGWSQISISSAELFNRSTGLGTTTSLLADVLSDETDAYFAWQFLESNPCPEGCQRGVDGDSCEAV